jgi:hypothetical protein
MRMKPNSALAAVACALALPAAHGAVAGDSFASLAASDASKIASLAAPSAGAAAAVPEPPTYALLIAGIVAAVLICHRRLRRRGDDNDT